MRIRIKFAWLVHAEFRRVSTSLSGSGVNRCLYARVSDALEGDRVVHLKLPNQVHLFA